MMSLTNSKFCSPVYLYNGKFKNQTQTQTQTQTQNKMKLSTKRFVVKSSLNDMNTIEITGKYLGYFVLISSTLNFLHYHSINNKLEKHFFHEKDDKNKK